MNKSMIAMAIVGILALAETVLPGGTAEDTLIQGFLNPPETAKPWAYWWWLDSFAAKEGITRDLEEMKRQGIGGVILFDAGEGGPDAPDGPKFMSSAWRELFKYAIAEADRLGIEVGVNLCNGWDCGGTWVTPEHTAKFLVWSSVPVQDPGKIVKDLPKPEVRDDYYRDIAVITFPDRGQTAGKPDKLTASSFQPGYQPELATDGNPETRWISNGDEPGEGPKPDRPEWLTWEFVKPIVAAALYVYPYPHCGPKECELECSDNGKSFRQIARFSVDQGGAQIKKFPETSARFFRLVIDSSYPFNGPKSWNVQIAEAWLLKKGERAPVGTALKHWDFKVAQRYLVGPAEMLHEEYPATPGEEDCKSKQVIDLTKQRDASGRLTWDVPEGRWTVLRFGYTLLGARTKCTTAGAEGYEVDYLSTEAMDLHFAETAEKLIADAGPLAGKTFKYVHDDSYEVAGPGRIQQLTWTPGFREEFRKRRGYDLLPFLPVFARRIVDSREVSNRFLWDYRRTLGDLFADHHYRRMHELAWKYGLGTHPECGGPDWPHIDALLNEGISEIPMGEFWKRGKEFDGAAWWRKFYSTCDTVKQAATATHIYGKPICQAEAYTSMGPNWEEDFFEMKDIGDLAFCAGLTRQVLCYYTHQPRLDAKPGNQWEGAGTHFDRNVTWWDQIDAWLAYLTRCQYLLQQGLFVADLCYFYGEDVPNYVPAKTAMRPPLPKGYDCDTVNADVLLNRLSAKDGRLVLPDGMSYRLLVLPERRMISPPILRKIAQLVEAGATAIGPRPERAPGLTNYPECDEEVKRLAERLWGNVDGQNVKERKVGKGRIVWGRSLQEILAGDGIPPDFEYHAAAKDANLDFIHRTSKTAEIYFVSNQLNRPEAVECWFRVTGKQPEIWDAVTSERWDATDFRQEGGRTSVPLEFAPRQSWFVVFRRPAKEPKNKRPNFPVLTQIAELAGPWTVKFDPKWGGPEQVVFEKLDDWTKRPEKGIKYYSGKATYKKTFDLPKDLGKSGNRLYLDLGRIENVAEVRLNGKDLGVVWTAPWRVEITDAVRPTGNRLEIDVVNLWPNRLIGDASLPPEKRLTKTNVKKFNKDYPLYPSGLLGPVTLQRSRRHDCPGGSAAGSPAVRASAGATGRRIA
jgi:hypothetical protein